MLIKEQQLFDYIECPTYYDLKWRKSIPTEKQISMTSLLNKVTDYFYSNLMQRRVCSIDELKRKWDKVCEQNSNYITTKKNLEGINYIINFARWQADNKTILLDYKSNYSIEINDIELQGNIGVIAMLPGRKCELIVNRFSNKELNQSEADRKLKYTLDCYAFKRKYNYDISAIKIISHKNNSVITTQRTMNDYDRLIGTISGVANAINADGYYPRESVFCSYCNLRNYCVYWS